MKKIITILISFCLIFLFSAWVFPLCVFATTIIDGDLIKTAINPDVYIVKIIPSADSEQATQYKRLILNPDIFNQYGHLKWENIKTVGQAVMDEYQTSDLVRAVNDDKVYKLYPNGDMGEKRWIKTGEDFTNLGYRADAIYEINNFERDSYIAGADLTYQASAEPSAPQRTTPMTIKVPADHSTIQEAVNAAINGDTISINSGTYKENLLINKSLTLISADNGWVVIDGNGVDNAVTIENAGNVSIKKFSVKSKDKYGIYCKGSDSSELVLKNSYLIESGWGIVAENNCKINLVNNLIYNNKLTSNADGAGILIKDSNPDIVSAIVNNTITNNYHGVWSENAKVQIMNNIISRNIGGTGLVDSVGIYHSGTGISNNTYNDVWSNGWEYKGDALAGNGSINQDPQFVNIYQHNYGLLSGGYNPSSCIDAGNPDFIYNDAFRATNDLDRNDMGAFGGPDNYGWQSY